MARIIKKFFEEITYIGGLFFFIFLIALFFFAGMRNYSIKLFIVLIGIYIITGIIRIIYFKQRPKKEEYDNFIEKIDASSFPSMHSARITFLCLFTLIFLNLEFFIKAIIIAFGILGVYSRVYLKKHDFVDVIGGILLGIFSLVVFLI